MVKNERTGHLSLLWEEYKKTGRDDLRNKLVEEYWYLVKKEAKIMKSKLPMLVELDDLVSAGTLGLIRTIKAFDPSRGIKFETYCVNRIKGAMLDELKKTTWVPYNVRQRTKQYNKAVYTLSSKTMGQKPTLQEVANYLGVSIEDAERIEKENTKGHVLQENKRYRGDGENFRNNEFILDQIPDKKSLSPPDEAGKEDGFYELTACLTTVDKKILNLYYLKGLVMNDIAVLVGKSKSRISQRHKEAIKRIKEVLSYNC